MPEMVFTIRAKDLSKDELRRFRAELDKTAKSFGVGKVQARKFGESLDDIGQRMGKLTMASGAVTAAATLMTKSFIGAAMDMERLTKAMIATTGSAEEAKKQMAELEEVAKLPGLGLEEAIQGSIRLQAVEMSAEEAKNTLAAFGNALATVGKGRNELRLVVEQLGQMASKSRVLGEDFRPILNQAPQIAKAMRDAFGVKTIEDIRSLGISSREFIQGVTRELGKLPSAGDTAANSVENLSDKMFKLRAALGETLLPAFASIINKISALVGWLNSLSKTQKAILAWGTVAVGAVSGLVAMFGAFAAMIPGIITGLGALKVAFLALGGPAGVIFAIVGAIAVAVPAILRLKRAKDQARESARDLNVELETLGSTLTDLEETEVPQAIADVDREIAQLTETLKEGEQASMAFWEAVLRGAAAGTVFSTWSPEQGERKELRDRLESLKRLRERLQELQETTEDSTDATEDYGAAWRKVGEEAEKAGEKLQQVLQDNRRTMAAMQGDELKRELALRKAEYDAAVQEIDAEMAATKGGTEVEEQLYQALQQRKILLEKEYLRDTKRLRDEALKEQRDRAKQERDELAALANEAVTMGVEARDISGIEQVQENLTALQDMKARIMQQIERIDTEYYDGVSAKREAEFQAEIAQLKESSQFLMSIIEQNLDRYRKGKDEIAAIYEEQGQIRDDFRTKERDEEQKHIEEMLEKHKEAAEKALEMEFKFAEETAQFNAKKRMEDLRDALSKAKFRHKQAFETEVRARTERWQRMREIGEKEEQDFIEKALRMKEKEKEIQNDILRTTERWADRMSNAFVNALVDSKGDFNEGIKGFLSDAAGIIQSEVTRMLAGAIAGELVKSLFGAAITGGAIGSGGMLGAAIPVLAKAGTFLSGVLGGGFDNPVHDYKAQLSGALTASQALGSRSAVDLINHFQTGFMSQAREIMTQTPPEINVTPNIVVELDGDNMAAKITQRQDKLAYREAGY